MTFFIGAHVPTSGGLVPSAGNGATPSAAEYIERIEANAAQIYIGNPRRWHPTAGDPDTDVAFADWAGAANIPIFIHAPMLINVASPRVEIVEKSIGALRHALLRGQRLGANGVVFHAGSAITADYRGRAYAQLGAALSPLLDEFSETGPMLLVEPTAGGGQPLAARLEDLGPYFTAVDHHDGLGVCLDTCHAMAAGHDISTAAGMAAAVDLIENHVGPGRLRLVHANDSKDPVGSHRDRHETIGAGTIGIASFTELLAHPAVKGVPLIVETPSVGDAGHRADVAALRKAATGG